MEKSEVEIYKTKLSKLNSCMDLYSYKGITSFTLGVLTRLAIGKDAYHSVGGAVGAGVLFSSHFNQASSTQNNTLLNIIDCEIGYFAGVAFTDYLCTLYRSL